MTSAKTWRDLTAAQAAKLIDDAREDGLGVCFLVPPSCGGQIVEHAYAGIGETGILCRITDASDRTVSYQIRCWRDSDEDRPGLNSEPA